MRGAVLGAAWRRNLEWPDGGITGTADQMRAAVELIRAASPRAIAIPHWGDRHPDHVAASRVLAEAAFKSRLRRYSAAGEPWQGGWVCYYFINDDFMDDSSNGGARPSFLIDVSAEYESKRRALACHRSQFQPAGADARPTRLTSPRFLQLIESRDAHYGALAGVAFAEAVVVREPIVRADLFKGA